MRTPVIVAWFTGLIPDFSKCTALSHLQLHWNKLTGNNYDHQWLYLIAFKIDLEGPVPDFSKNIVLRELSLHNNHLSGKLTMITTANTQLLTVKCFLRDHSQFQQVHYPREAVARG